MSELSTVFIVPFVLFALSLATMLTALSVETIFTFLAYGAHGLDRGGSSGQVATLYLSAVTLENPGEYDQGVDQNVILLGTDPRFDRLRKEPRFIRIVEALGLPNGGPTYR